MECSNCREVLESGCSISAGLRQEDRLILDWEKRHKGRSCSGAPRPFGKLKKKRGLGEAAYPYCSCAPDSKSSHKKMLSCVWIACDRGRFGCSRSVKVEILDNGHFLLSTVDIQQPLMLISGNNNERKMLANCISPLPSPPRRCLCGERGPRCDFTPVCCCASIVSLRGGDPVSAGCISSPALYSGGGFRLSKHLRATAFLANTESAISPFLSLRH